MRIKKKNEKLVTLNTNEITCDIAKRLGTTKTLAKSFLNAMRDSIITAISEGKSVCLVNFLKLVLCVSKEKKLKNPRSGNVFNVDEAVKVKVKVGGSIKEAAAKVSVNEIKKLQMVKKKKV